MVYYLLNMEKKKVLIIRFSSFGDILQCFTSATIIRQNWSGSEIAWLTRSDFENLVSKNLDVNRVISFDRKLGLLGLIKLALKLRQEKFDLVYDAHNNVRSLIVRLFIFFPNFFSAKLIIREKSRFKRFLLFSLRINKFPNPYRGRISFESPIKNYGFNLGNHDITAKFNFLESDRNKVDSILKNLENKNWITCVPSAAWEMKRWPVSHWEKMLELLNENYFFVFLGGPQDHFIKQLCESFPEKTLNLAGKLSLVESSYLVTKSNWIISNDTGLLHVADLCGVHGLSLQGPTAFGFTTHPHIETVEVNLPCRPCSKDGSGKCTQVIYQKCMVDIKPEFIVHKTINFFHSKNHKLV